MDMSVELVIIEWIIRHDFSDFNREAIGVFDNLWIYCLLVVSLTLTTLRVWLLWLNSEAIRRVFIKLTSRRTY